MRNAVKPGSYLGVQQIIRHDVARASRILRERGVPHSLMLNQHRVLISKNTRGKLRAAQRSDRVDLPMGTVDQRPLGSNREVKETDRVSNDQDAVAQSFTLESRQGFDGTNWPLGNCRPDINGEDVRERTEGKCITYTPDHEAPTGVHGQSRDLQRRQGSRTYR